VSRSASLVVLLLAGVLSGCQCVAGRTTSTSKDNSPADSDTLVARILIDPQTPSFHECRSHNDDSAPVVPVCLE
jgi:hypothetical protein